LVETEFTHFVVHGHFLLFFGLLCAAFIGGQDSVSSGQDSVTRKRGGEFILHRRCKPDFADIGRLELSAEGRKRLGADCQFFGFFHGDFWLVAPSRCGEGF
jgi:hypothetical protein